MKPQVEINKCCALCETGRLSADEQVVLCEKKGIVRADYVCKKFRYDPLKRNPSFQAEKKFEVKNFEL